MLMTPTPWADDMDLASEDAREFGYGEHLLIWTWRRLACGCGDCPAIRRAFQEACGEDGGDVLATILIFLALLTQGRRRTLTVGYPSSLALTPHERQMLTLIAAAQHDETALFDAHLNWLAGATHRDDLAIGARAAARALIAHALALPLPENAPPPSARKIALAHGPTASPRG